MNIGAPLTTSRELMIPEDRKLLKSAGWLGHTYIGISGDPGSRRVNCEVTDLSSARRWTPIGGTIYKRNKKTWTFVETN